MRKSFHTRWYDLMNANQASYFRTRKATGFKSLRLNYWEINQATSKCQIDFWTKLAKKVTVKFCILKLV